MARRATLGTGSLSPFGGGSVSFGLFNVVDLDQQAYLTFLKSENAWQDGQISDAEYLAALQTYANALTPGSSNQLNAQQRLEETTYRVHRNTIIAGIDDGTATWAELLTYDRDALEGLNTASQTYIERRDRLRNTQAGFLADEAKVVDEQFQAGQMTATQLRSWYQDQLANSLLAGNPELEERIRDQITSLDQRIVGEQDSRTITDYSDGKMTPEQFLAYAFGARARYGSGTPQAQDWDKRIAAAQRDQQETGLLYRYNLSQQYAQLQQFIASNSGKSLGGTSTSTSTRLILGADGQWKTVKTTTTKPTAPSAAEQDAYRKLQVQMNDAKAQMREIEAKMSGLPNTGWVTTDQVLDYYGGQQSQFVRGSGVWYAIQGKIDSLNERRHAEQVLAGQGIRITYPGVSTSGAGSSGGASGRSLTTQGRVSIESFMAAIARVESGGRYDARNASSGAYGKYQIMPANWPSWAKKYLGSSNAPQTPENQEKVARGKMLDLYNWLGSWESVAHWWLTGDGSKDPGTWSTSSTNYVNKVMGYLGVGPVSRSGGPLPTAGPYSGGGGGGGYTATTTTPGITSTKQVNPKTGARNPPGTLPGIAGKGPLSIVTGVSRALDYEGQGTHYTFRQTGFPANMDSSAFTAFYNAYENAYRSGAETFTITDSRGNPTTYFIGADPGDRLNRMQELDDLKIAMLETKAQAYAGTATEITAANQLNTAYKDAAAHDYLTLATSVPGTWSSISGERKFYPQEEEGPVPGPVVNPLYAGERMLDKLTSGVAWEVAKAKEAWARGDFRAAYAHLQLANRTFDGNSVYFQGAQGYLVAAQQVIQAIASQTGMSPETALGSEAGKVTGSLERLLNMGTEVAELLEKTGYNELRDELAGVIKGGERPVLDAAGNVQLDEGMAVFVTAAGKVQIKPITPTDAYDPGQSGRPSVTTPGHTPVIINTGTTVVEAYAEYKTGRIGSMVTPDGVEHALMGKFVVMRDPTTGRQVVTYQNPFTGRWSNAPVKYNAPASLTESLNPDGSTTLVLKAPLEARGRGTQGLINQNDGDGTEYLFQFDAKTGTYLLVRRDPGGLFRSPDPGTPLPVGMGSQNLIDYLSSAGITEIGRGDATLGNSPFPMIGFTEQSAASWLQVTPQGRSRGGSWGDPPSVYSGPYVSPYDPDAAGDPNWVHPNWAAGNPGVIPQANELPVVSWTSPSGTGAQEFELPKIAPSSYTLPPITPPIYIPPPALPKITWRSPSGTGAEEVEMPKPPAPKPKPKPKTPTISWRSPSGTGAEEVEMPRATPGPTISWVSPSGTGAVEEEMW